MHRSKEEMVAAYTHSGMIFSWQSVARSFAHGMTILSVADLHDLFQCIGGCVANGTFQYLFFRLLQGINNHDGVFCFGAQIDFSTNFLRWHLGGQIDDQIGVLFHECSTFLGDSLWQFVADVQNRFFNFVDGLLVGQFFVQMFDDQFAEHTLWIVLLDWHGLFFGNTEGQNDANFLRCHVFDDGIDDEIRVLLHGCDACLTQVGFRQIFASVFQHFLDVLLKSYVVYEKCMDN